jgi:hypothetical protein
LDDNSTKFASARIHNFSHLESIEVFTTGDNVNLVDVFQAMEKSGGSLPDTKDNGAVKKYFESAYPDLDFERVYPSDLKKMVKWFDSLKKNNIEIKLSEPLEEEAEEVAVEDEPKEKPAKKETKKKEEVADEKPRKKETIAEKPAKKTAKKKDEDKEDKPKRKPAAKKK